MFGDTYSRQERMSSIIYSYTPNVAHVPVACVAPRGAAFFGLCLSVCAEVSKSLSRGPVGVFVAPFWMGLYPPWDA